MRLLTRWREVTLLPIAGCDYLAPVLAWGWQGQGAVPARYKEEDFRYRRFLPRESDELGTLLGNDGNHSPTRPSTIIPQDTPYSTKQADLPNPCCWHLGPLPISPCPMSLHVCSSESPFFSREPHSKILSSLHHQDGDLWARAWGLSTLDPAQKKSYLKYGFALSSSCSLHSSFLQRRRNLVSIYNLFCVWDERGICLEGQRDSNLSVKWRGCQYITWRSYAGGSVWPAR